MAYSHTHIKISHSQLSFLFASSIFPSMSYDFHELANMLLFSPFNRKQNKRKKFSWLWLIGNLHIYLYSITLWKNSLYLLTAICVLAFHESHFLLSFCITAPSNLFSQGCLPYWHVHIAIHGTVVFPASVCFSTLESGVLPE